MISIIFNYKIFKIFIINANSINEFNQMKAEEFEGEIIEDYEDD